MSEHDNIRRAASALAYAADDADRTLPFYLARIFDKDARDDARSNMRTEIGLKRSTVVLLLAVLDHIEYENSDTLRAMSESARAVAAVVNRRRDEQGAS